MRMLVLGLLLALAAAAVPAAEATEVVTGSDPHGDVRITKAVGLDAPKRRTIDLRRLSVTETEKGPRFQLRLRRVVANGSFDQYFFVYLEGGDGQQFAFLKIKASKLRGSGGLEGADNPNGYAACRVEGRVSPDRRRLTVTLPNRCTPKQSVKVSVLAYTTPLGEEGGVRVFSRDRLRVPGLVDVRD
ncbi:MAG TPA: hypothetical protein VFO49_12555 [Nocardioides sp.]|nr:hypothetical protein [Nocardioides sp.]